MTAYSRVEGIGAITTFMEESMRGLDDMKSMHWRPAPDFVPPPAEPNRDFSVP